MSLWGDCPECGKGWMREVGNFMYMTNPPMVDVQCEKCGFMKKRTVGSDR